MLEPSTRRGSAARAGPADTQRHSSTPDPRGGRTPRTSPPGSTRSRVAKTDPRLYQAYLLNEGLRLLFQLPDEEAVEALEVWIGWALRCRIPAFVDPQHRIVKHQATILAAIEHKLSHGLIASVNTKIGLLTRIGFGFRSAEALIALAMLTLGSSHRPALSGRA